MQEIEEAVRGARRVHVRGAGTKPALSRPQDDLDAHLLDLSSLRGVVDYLAEEYTFTARAGTPVADVAAMLAEKGQYLPFDPPLAARGATLGGTVAAGLSGAGRYRYGGIRDFLIGIRFVDGRGREIRGGGAVVKNAAGFDFPKLFVGSLGRLGILTELTFKVFPRPPAFATVAADFGSLSDLLSALHAVTGSAIDLHAVDFAPAQEAWTLWVRIGGLLAALQERARALQSLISTAAPASARSQARAERSRRAPKILLDREDDDHWQSAVSMSWLPRGADLVRVPLTPQRVTAMEGALAACPAAARRYSVGGNLLWLGWPSGGAAAPNGKDPVSGRRGAGQDGPPTTDLHHLLLRLNAQGLRLTGPDSDKAARRDAAGPLLGRPVQNRFLRRIAAALDPEGKFGGF